MISYNIIIIMNNNDMFKDFEKTFGILSEKVNSKKEIKLIKISKDSFFCHYSVIFMGHYDCKII